MCKVAIVHDSSSLCFIYPFELCDKSEYLGYLEKVTSKRWLESELGWHTHPVAKSKDSDGTTGFPDDVFLPHVGRFLNRIEYDESNVQLFYLSPTTLQSSATLLGGPSSSCCWELCFDRHDSEPIKFKWIAIQLALFSTGLGMLILQIRPDDQDLDVWLDFAHYFRFTRGQRGTWLTATKKTGQLTVEPWIPPVCVTNHSGYALQAGMPKNILLKHIIDGLITYEGSVADSIHRQVFTNDTLIPYAGLFVDGVEQKKTGEVAYRMSRVFHSRMVIHQPETFLENIAGFGRVIQYGIGQWFLLNKESITFVCFDRPPKSESTQFFYKELPAHLLSHYLIMFLLALHQRYALVAISRSLTDLWTKKRAKLDFIERELNDIRPFGRRFQSLVKERHRVLKSVECNIQRLHDDFVMYTTQSHFSQVAQSETHQQFFSVCRKALEIEPLFQEVRDEIQEVYENRIALGMQQNVDSIATAQRALHLIEYLLAATYAAELIHIVDGDANLLHSLSVKISSFFYSPPRPLTHAWSQAFEFSIAALIGIVLVEWINFGLERKWIFFGRVSRVLPWNWFK